MAQKIIGIGAAANDGTGDTWRDAMDKANDNFTEVYGLTTVTKRVLVNSLSDLPTPSAGVITLADATQYLLANDIALGTDRLVFGEGTSLSGIESILISMTYSGTGDMITCVDNTIRVSNIALDAPSGRVFNWSDTTGKILRVNDVTIVSCNKVGLFSGTTGVIRFTNVSPASITADGLEFTGNFRSFLYDTSASTIGAGALFNLGTATFDSFIADTILVTLNGTSNLVSGAASSANINSGGIGLVERMRISGPGTPLSGISVDDALWEFEGNDDIADTRADALISMQANATNTVITVSGTYVLIAGTWVVESDSQFTSTTAGRMTYNGGKDARVPIIFSCSVEPASGTNKDISLKVALNGVVIDNSKRTARVDSGSPSSVTCPWQLTLSTGDYVEIFATNDTDAIDVLCSSAVGRIN